MSNSEIPEGGDPFNAHLAAQSTESFQAYLGYVCDYARGDEEARNLYNRRLSAAIVPAILREAGYEVGLTVPEQRLPEAQERQAIDVFEGMGNDLVAVTALVAFGETAGSALAFERALERYTTVSPTKDALDAAWTNFLKGVGKPPGEYLKVGRLGGDISRGLARAGLFEKASSALRVTAASHNEQMSVNAIAYTLHDTAYPDTMRWCMRELVSVLQDYPLCNIKYMSAVLTEACSRLVEYGATDDDEVLMRTAILAVETHYKE